ncbi:MAG: hypothetical protein ACXAE3_05910 [Candidatus Kariarchaeaceae archaeon]|jgi:hypothetical protein
MSGTVNEPRILDRYQDLLDTIPGINYIIDKDYKISLYSKSKWDNFAVANDGSELAESESIVGKSVLDFFAGKKVREHYKTIYDMIFEGKRDEIKITAKCDAPEVLRDNVIFLTPVFNDPSARDEIVGVLHQSLILKVDSRPPVEILRKAAATTSVDNFLEICSICKFVNYENEGQYEWIPAERYYQLGGTDEVKLEQSICGDCSTMMNEFM